MKQTVTLPDVFLYCHSSKSVALGVARALQGLVCSSPAEWPRINAAFVPRILPTQWTHLEGQQAGLLLLRLLSQRPGRPSSLHGLSSLNRPQRFNLVGHGVGCRFLCSALQALAEDAPQLARLAGSEFNIALLQPDADSDPHACGQLRIPRLRMLIATSDLDSLAVPVDQRFNVTTTAVPTFTAPMGVADVTALRGADGEFDINHAQIYELLARFFGQ